MSIDDATPEEWDQAIDMLAINNQVGGQHYKGNGIQPIEYIYANGLSWSMGNVLKLITRDKVDKVGTDQVPSLDRLPGKSRPTKTEKLNGSRRTRWPGSRSSHAHQQSVRRFAE